MKVTIEPSIEQTENLIYSDGEYLLLLVMNANDEYIPIVLNNTKDFAKRYTSKVFKTLSELRTYLTIDNSFLSFKGKIILEQ